MEPRENGWDPWTWGTSVGNIRELHGKTAWKSSLRKAMEDLWKAHGQLAEKLRDDAFEKTLLNIY